MANARHLPITRLQLIAIDCCLCATETLQLTTNRFVLSSHVTTVVHRSATMKLDDDKEAKCRFYINLDMLRAHFASRLQRLPVN